MRRFAFMVAFIVGMSSMAPAFASVSTDKWEYARGETVYIEGDEMAPGETVVVEIFYPDGSPAQRHEVTADGEGDFSDTYVLPDDAPDGIYDLTATGQTSGNVYVTQFDPCTLTLSAVTVDYSDVATFTGTLGASGPGCPSGVASRTIDIAVDTNANGSLADEGTFASGTTDAAGVYSIASPKIALTPGGGAESAGDFRMEARLNGTATKSTPFSRLAVDKEDTTTAYTGATSGGVGTNATVSGDTDDADASSFTPDVNVGGTAKMTFELFDEADTTSAAGPVSADVDGSGVGSTSLTLPAAPGTYKMRTGYLGTNHYKSSDDATHDTVCVYSLSLDDETVDYSDVVTFTGTLSGGSSPCEADGKAVDIFVDADGNGTLDATPFASGTTDGLGNYSIDSSKVDLTPGNGTESGAYKAQARFGSIASTVETLGVDEEDTTTAYGGGSSGGVGTSLSVSADVDDEADSSSLMPDANMVGTDKLSFELYDATNTTSVAGPVSADVDSSGVGSTTLTLPSTAGTYSLRTTYAGNGYYNTSSDLDTVCIYSLSLDDETVDYSDVVSFSGTLTGGSSPCEADGKTIDIVVDTDGDGDLGDETTFATGTTDVAGAFSIDSLMIGLTPGGGTETGGAYKARAEFGDIASDGTLGVDKEDTTTAYGGGTSGGVGTSLSVSADVDDEADSSSFMPDANIVGTGTLTFELYDAANTTSVAGPVSADVDSSGVGATTLTLPSTAGTYSLRTTYAGNGYYNTSSDLDTVCVYSLSLDDETVDYSDVASFTGTLSGGTAPCGAGGKTVDIFVDADGNGTLDATPFASGTTDGLGNYSIATLKIGLAPGAYETQARFGSIASSEETLTVDEEDTTTAYTGATSGDLGTSLSVSADVNDQADGSSWMPDANMVGTGTLTFQLYDATNTTSVAGPVSADVDSSGVGSTTLTLPSTAGTYTMRTTYAGNGYYDTSSDTDVVTVNDPVVADSVCEFGRILPPVNRVSGPNADGISGYKFGARGVVPAKFRLTCDGDLVDTSAEASAVGDVTLELAKLTSGGTPDDVIETTTTGSANTGNLFRFDDAGDLYVYNIGIKGLGVGSYRIRVSGAGASQDEYFQIV